MTPAPGISVAVVSWNTRDLLLGCLESLLADAGALDMEVVVVDNASTDSTAEMMQERFPQVTFLRNEANLGFAAANNQALRLSDAPHLLLLNPDTVVHPGAIDALVAHLDHHPDAGAVGPRLLNPDGSHQISCHPFPSLARELWRLLHLDLLAPFAAYSDRKWSRAGSESVDSVQGACLLVRQRALAEAGALDDGYFIYSEEVDLCLRLRQLGWGIDWLSAAKVTHYGGQSTRQAATPMFLQLYRAKVQYFRKHRGRAAARAYKGILAFASLVRITAARLAPHVSGAGAVEGRSLVRHYLALLSHLPRM